MSDRFDPDWEPSEPGSPTGYRLPPGWQPTPLGSPTLASQPNPFDRHDELTSGGPSEPVHRTAEQESTADFNRLAGELRDLKTQLTAENWNNIADVLDETRSQLTADPNSLENIQSTTLTLAKKARRPLIESDARNTAAYRSAKELEKRYAHAAVPSSTAPTWSIPRRPVLQQGQLSSTTSSTAALQSPPPARQPSPPPLPDATRTLAYESLVDVWNMAHEQVSPHSNQALNEVQELLEKGGKWSQRPTFNDIDQNRRVAAGVIAVLERQDSDVPNFRQSNLYKAAESATQTFESIRSEFQNPQPSPNRSTHNQQTAPTNWDPQGQPLRRSTLPADLHEEAVRAPARSTTFPSMADLGNALPHRQPNRESERDEEIRTKWSELTSAFYGERPNMSTYLSDRLYWNLAQANNLGPSQRGEMATAIEQDLRNSQLSGGELHRQAQALNSFHHPEQVTTQPQATQPWQQVPTSWHGRQGSGQVTQHQQYPPQTGRPNQTQYQPYRPPTGGWHQPQGQPGAGHQR
ncbi:hypothetical protein ABT336_16870 [Micromonospora sp. NPDC000207]|uniref:hypothetical protein n=1 Tax=Micromonospora sp. NPDC000207 TaxID=3154246 RepID=UPI00332BC6D4